MSRRMLTAIIATGFVLTAAACTSSAPDESGEGAATKNAGSKGAKTELVITNIEDAQIDLNSLGDKDWNATLDSSVIIYDAAGSGSCKPIIEKAVLEDTTVTLTRFDYSGKPCTMDLRQFRQEIAMPDGSDFPENTSVVVVDPTSN